MFLSQGQLSESQVVEIETRLTTNDKAQKKPQTQKEKSASDVGKEKPGSQKAEVLGRVVRASWSQASPARGTHTWTLLHPTLVTTHPSYSCLPQSPHTSLKPRTQELGGPGPQLDRHH